MILCIDPGSSKPPGGTGYAFFGDGLLPERTGNLTSTKNTWEEREAEITQKLVGILDSIPIARREVVYIELPTFFESDKGMMCATGKNNDDSDLVKLSVLVGMFSVAAGFLGYKVKLIRVNEWKGNLRKPVVTQRIANRLGTTVDDLPFSNHAIDAVGIGMYVKGVFKANAGTNRTIKRHKVRPKRSGVTRESNKRGSETVDKRPRPNNKG